jgi:uncharacterized protein HemX
MSTFTLDPRRWWPMCVFGRNPLIRAVDRLEVLMIVVAFVLSLIAIPIAGALGTAVYGARHQLYVQQAQTRHPVVTMVIADAAVVDNEFKPPEQSKFWLDNDGNRVSPPTPASRAGAEGIAAGAAVFLIVVATTAGVVFVAHSQLSQIRSSQWERELRCLADDDGGRNNWSCG